MTAPRACRSCGAELSPDVRWCGLCAAPVTEFAARPATPGPFVGSPRNDVRWSRWRESPTTFGPVGRLLVTLAVVAVGANAMLAMGPFSPFGLWFFMGYMVFATLVLKQTWQKVRADETSPGWRAKLDERHPMLGAQVNARAVRWGAAVVGLAIVLVAAIRSDQVGRFAITVVVVMLGVGSLLAWLAGV